MRVIRIPPRMKARFVELPEGPVLRLAYSRRRQLLAVVAPLLVGLGLTLASAFGGLYISHHPKHASPPSRAEAKEREHGETSPTTYALLAASSVLTSLVLGMIFTQMYQLNAFAGQLSLREATLWGAGKTTFLGARDEGQLVFARLPDGVTELQITARGTPPDTLLAVRFAGTAAAKNRVEVDRFVAVAARTARSAVAS